MAQRKITIDESFITLMGQIDSGEIMLKDAAAMLNVSPAALCQKRKKLALQKPPESLTILSPPKRLFCEARAAGFSNKQAAKLAYPNAKEKSLPVIASQIMAEPNAQTAIIDLMARHGIDRNHRVSRLADVINSTDLNLAVKGLDQSWKLDGSYAAEKVDLSINETEIRALIAALDIPPKIIDITPTD